MLGRRHAAVALASLAGALALAACETDDMIDKDKAEQLVADTIKEDLNQQVEVSCPDDVEVKKGDTFDCEVTGDVSGTAKVTQTSDDGDVIAEFKPPAGQGKDLTINIDLVEREIQEQVQKQGGVENVTVRCPEEVPIEKGNTFDCQVSGGATGTSTVKQVDDTGNVEIEFAPDQ